MRASWIMWIGLVACGFSPKGQRGAGVCVDSGGRRDVVPPAVGDLVITEIMAKPKKLSALAAQWFEVFAQSDLDLNGVTMERASAASVVPEVIAAEECLHLAAGSYAVFARSQDAAQNGQLSPRAAFSFSLNPDDNPDVQLVYGGEVIDRVAWTASTSGASLQLDPGKTDAVANDEPGSFCDATDVYEVAGGNKGSPGVANPPCPRRLGVGECVDGLRARPIVKPLFGELVITEFLANPSGSGNDAMQEWFEIANTGATSFDLNGLTVASATMTNIVDAMECVTVAPGSFALFAHSTDPEINGGLPEVDATFAFPLANRDGSLRVLDGTAVLDGIGWTTPVQRDGISRQLRPSHKNVVDNDAEDHFCVAAPEAAYGTGGNVGTPRAANSCATESAVPAPVAARVCSGPPLPVLACAI